MSLVEALRRANREDAARPLITFYDDDTGERTELSVITTENWVAKTANLLVDDLGVVPGQRLGLALPLHWQGLVWAYAAWSAGSSSSVKSAATRHGSGRQGRSIAPRSRSGMGTPGNTSPA